MLDSCFHFWWNSFTHMESMPVNKFGAVFEWHFWAHEIWDILQQTLNPWIVVIVHTPQKVTLPNLQNKKNTGGKVIDRCNNMWHHIKIQCKTKDTFIKYHRCQQGVPGFTLSRSVCVYVDFVYEKWVADERFVGPVITVTLYGGQCESSGKI